MRIGGRGVEETPIVTPSCEVILRSIQNLAIRIPDSYIARTDLGVE
jgi:hypothetical protein